MSRPTPDNQRTRKVLWLANLTAVMLLAAIILFLPQMVQPSDLPNARLPVLVLALLSLPAAFMARRISGMNSAREPLQSGKPTDPKQAQKETSRFAIAGTLAELPAMFGLVYTLLGGNGFHGLLFAAAALLATMLLRPE